MHFSATHDVTADDVARAEQLAARRAELLISAFVVLVLGAVIIQVLHAFGLYVGAVVKAPEMLSQLLRFGAGDIGNSNITWLSIIVVLALPVFLFYALRSLLEALRPSWRVRRLLKNSYVTGTTSYTVDDRGVRSVRAGGADVFLPWSNFDTVKSDGDLAVLLRNSRLVFFVPLTAFGADRDALLAHLKARVSSSR